MNELDTDICADCGEHTEFEETEFGYESECCGAGPINIDYDFDMER